jgi:hypothetical protein
MAKKSLGNLIGGLAFLLGIILAFVAGILSGFDLVKIDASAVTLTLVIIGIIIGLLNITAKESTPFLFSGLALIISSVFGTSVMATLRGANDILISLLAIFIPATIIVAVKNVLSLARN